jgi:hypothetical protein
MHAAIDPLDMGFRWIQRFRAGSQKGVEANTFGDWLYWHRRFQVARRRFGLAVHDVGVLVLTRGGAMLRYVLREKGGCKADFSMC